MRRAILMVDDPHLGKLLGDALAGLGCESRLTKTVPQCLTLLNEIECDFLITDFFTSAKGRILPISGASLIIAVRFAGMAGNNLNVDSGLPIIVIGNTPGTRTQDDVREICTTLGADATLQEPVEPGDLRQAVEIAFRADRRRAGDERGICA